MVILLSPSNFDDRSKRAFQTQFKRWGFPSKQNPAHKNVDLVARVKELWERNTSQRDMLKILNDEGFDIKERELMRVRAKNRWLLRVPNGMKAQGTSSLQAPADDEGLLGALQQEVYQQEGDFTGEAQLQTASEVPRGSSPGLSSEVLAKRKERLERLQAESAERWASRKRRRRTRGWAGLPADPPGPPRFPSETTIDESKQYLNLDNAMYRQIRDHFQSICEEAGFIKKTIAGPERWEVAKDRLIAESPRLQSVFWGANTQLDAKRLALDVVCTDVTKRMRTLERRMTIAEAKNALGVNPEESRQIRNAFYNTLKADHFTSKLEAGDEHWKELKEQWIQGSPLLQSIHTPGDADPEHTTKVKAMEVLCRDVMKRLRDDQTKRDPSRQHRNSNTATNTFTNEMNNEMNNDMGNGISNGISTLASQALASAPIIASDISDMQIDPSLLQAANDPSFAMDHHHQHQATQSMSYIDPMLDVASSSSSSSSIPVYFRPNPESQIHQSEKMWLATLSSRSIAELRQLVLGRYPDCAVVRIDGTEKDASGNEVSYLIEEDEELDAYLTHVQGRKAVFVLLLNGL